MTIKANLNSPDKNKSAPAGESYRGRKEKGLLSKVYTIGKFYARVNISKPGTIKQNQTWRIVRPEK